MLPSDFESKFTESLLTFSNDKLGVAFADTKSFCICSAENLQGNI